MFHDMLGPILTFLKKAITPLPQCFSAKCDFYGNYVYEWSTDSISIEPNNIVFRNAGMVCYRCWNVCPRNAISIKFSPADGIIERTLDSPMMESYSGKMEKDEYKYLGPNLYKDVLGRKINLMKTNTYCACKI